VDDATLESLVHAEAILPNFCSSSDFEVHLPLSIKVSLFSELTDHSTS
jgi:hypothetical protein